MYKNLLNKGFKPIYYTNNDWENRPYKTRLFYNYDIGSKELLNTILGVLEIYNIYFFTLINEDCVAQLEVDENLEEYWLYFYNCQTENYQITKEDFEKVINVLPNAFTFEDVN